MVGHVGRFTYAKNHNFLLDIFSEFSIKKENAILLLVGDGELHQAIVNKVKEKGIEKKVVFIGRVSVLKLCYLLADVIVILSIFEGLSLVTIESQVADVPSVVSEPIPEEAVISNGVKRLKLSDDNRADEVIEIADNKVVLNENSKDYNRKYTVRKLQN